MAAGARQVEKPRAGGPRGWGARPDRGAGDMGGARGAGSDLGRPAFGEAGNGVAPRARFSRYFFGLATLSLASSFLR